MKKQSTLCVGNALAILLIVALSVPYAFAQSVPPDVARTIAKVAYIYGYPLVDNYRTVYSYFVDSSGPQFRAHWNQPSHTTLPDKTASSSDTNRWELGADLRTEPLVLTMPALDKHGYAIVQELNLFTFDLAYAGGRSTGVEGGSFLLVGPQWRGDKPNGIKDVIRSATEFAFVLYTRAPVGAVRSKDNKQAVFKVQPLHEFLAEPAPPPAPKVDFMKPLTVKQQGDAVEFFQLLNFILRFCPEHPSQKALMTQLAKLNIGPDANYSFNVSVLSPDMRQALNEGAADAIAFQRRDYATAAEANAADIAGSRDFLGSDSARLEDGGLNESGPLSEYATYRLTLMESTARRFDEPTAPAQTIFDQQFLPMYAHWSHSVFTSTFSYMNPSPYNPYWMDGP